jgi:hypothetical protein
MEFVKVQTKLLESSIMDEDPIIRLAWHCLLLMTDWDGYIFGTVSALARRANIEPEDMQRALEIFTNPDDNSTSKEHEGRRILDRGGNSWEIVNFVKYRVAQHEDIIKQQKRKSMQKTRLAERGIEWDEEAWYRGDCEKYKIPLPDWVDANVDLRGSTLTYKEEDLEEEVHPDNVGGNTVSSNSSNTPKRKPVSANPPTVEEIHEHILSKGAKANKDSIRLAQQIVEHHETGGEWRTNKGAVIYSWKSHVNQWIERRWGGDGTTMSGRLRPNVKKQFADDTKARVHEDKLRKEREAKIAARIKS